MQFLRKVLIDVRQGENIDLYLTVIIAAGIAVANIFGLTSGTLVGSATLAVLALLVSSSLSNRHQTDQFFELLKSYVSENTLEQTGLVCVSDALEFENLKSRMVAARKRIIIFDNWVCENMIAFEKVLCEASKRKVAIQIALLDPKSSFAIQRSLDLGKETDYVSNEVKRNTREISMICKRNNLTNIELRYFSAFPSLQMYTFDNQALICFYTYGIESQYVPQIHVDLTGKNNEPTKIGRMLEENFRKVWEEATPVSLEESN
ncbi:MAG: hypothetical protein QNJ51_23045 [Calothrix sp. MO_167.B12]|nr:hypothetical protein [Calothrix sp. MO_167.B12]